MAPEEHSNKRNVKVLATPAVRRIAQEYGVNLGDVRGSGKEGSGQTGPLPDTESKKQESGEV